MSSAGCFGTRQDWGVKDITLQPIRLVLCERLIEYQTLLQHTSGNNLIFIPWSQSSVKLDKVKTTGLWYGSCYKYQLSDQYPDQISDKNIRFYSQRYSRCSILQTQLEEHPRHLLNKSWTKHMTGSTTKVHISSFGPCTHTSARSGDWTPTLRPGTSGIHPLCYQHLSLWLHLLAIPGILPTAENCYMNCKDCPLDIKNIFPYYTPLVSFPLLPYLSTPLVHTIPTCINR